MPENSRPPPGAAVAATDPTQQSTEPLAGTAPVELLELTDLSDEELQPPADDFDAILGADALTLLRLLGMC